MKRFKNILMIYAQRVGDEAALARATELAKGNAARLTIVQVLDSVAEPSTEFLAERQAQLERLSVSVRHEGVEVSTRVLRGREFLEIVRLVIRDGFDLVVMAADSVEGLRALTFGTTSMHLMRKCPCPVWVMKPSAGGRFRKILAAVAPAVDGPPDPLDIKILQMATSLARSEGGRLDVVHAWELTGADLETSRSETTKAIRKRLRDRNAAGREAAVEAVMAHAELDGLAHEVHVHEGRPEIVLPELARSLETDLIVMGTVRRGGIAGFLIGTTAEYTLYTVGCSVLTLKPDNFITPVSLND
jgi:nucleotide-binding universal stress UspA family protein